VVGAVVQELLKERVGRALIAAAEHALESCRGCYFARYLVRLVEGIFATQGPLQGFPKRWISLPEYVEFVFLGNAGIDVGYDINIEVRTLSNDVPDLWLRSDRSVPARTSLAFYLDSSPRGNHVIPAMPSLTWIPTLFLFVDHDVLDSLP